jgi:hypothetical protein
MEAWLESMRMDAGPEGLSGYGGPVVHWWRDSLRYCGPAFDWRYEGIVRGYLALFERTGDRAWLGKARRAGDDLVAAQLPGGTFQRSRFEQNPGTAGTPHEFAVDVALLVLARALRGLGDVGWSRYMEAALRNVEAFCVGRLWDEAAQSFRDDPERPSFVPNKTCTLVEALLLLAELTGEAVWLDRYVLPSLEAVLRLQVRCDGDPLDGGIAQNSFGARVIEKYFPYYAARCVPALLGAHAQTGNTALLDGALRVGGFLRRWQDPDGGWPQVVYPGGRVNRHPRWIAGAADVYRALHALRDHDVEATPAVPNRAAAVRWLLAGQLSDGAPRTAIGFASHVNQHPVSAADVPDARDLFPVVGWADKAFRYLAEHVDALGDAPSGGAASPAEQPAVDLPCLWRGSPARYVAGPDSVRVVADERPLWWWDRRSHWARTAGGGQVP